MMLRYCFFAATLLAAFHSGHGQTPTDEGVVCQAYPAGTHFQTWGSVFFDYLRGCDLVLIKNQGFPGGGLDLHIRTVPMGGWSGITNVAVRIGSDVLEVVDDGTYFLTSNGQSSGALTPPYGGYVGTLGGHDVRVFENGKWAPKYEIYLPNEQVIVITRIFGSLRVKVTANGPDFSQSQGLCGTWGLPDFIGPNGEVAADANAHGDNWQVAAGTTIFNTSPSPGVCVDPGTYQGEDPEITEEKALEFCVLAPNKKRRNNCVFDVMTTRDSRWAKNPIYVPGTRKGETCKVYPDPHFKTWDGQYFTNNLGCDVVLISNPAYPAVGGLNLHVRLKPLGGYSGISNAAVQIGGDIFEVDNDDNYYLNGAMNVPPVEGGFVGTVGGHDVTVKMQGKYKPAYTIELADGQAIKISRSHDSLKVVVIANSPEFEESQGLCGTWGLPKYMNRDGTVDFYPEDNDFVSHWQSGPSDPQLFTIPPPPGQLCDGPESGPGTVPGVDPGVASALAFDACAHVAGEEEKKNCVYDVETTGDVDWALDPEYAEAADAGAGGDPHFHTFGGEYFAYHGVCDLVLLHNTEFADGLGLDIHIRTEERDGYSSISNAAIRIGSDVLEIVNDGTHFINGVLNAELPGKIGIAYDVTKTGATETEVFLPDVSHGFTQPELAESTLYDVDLGNEESIQIQAWKDYLWVNVRAGPLNLNGSVGLMGTWGATGKVARDGLRIIEDPNEFGEEWQVLGTEPKLFQTIRAPQYPETCLPAPTAVVGRRLRMESHADEACAHVQGPKNEFCRFDVIVTGDVGIARMYRN